MLKLIVHVITQIRHLYATVTENIRKETLCPSGEADDKNKQNDEETIKHKILIEKGYILEDVLGKGSFSYVLKAYSKKHHRYVAIKIITRENVPVLYMQKFLPREIKLIKTLRHKNIIKFISITETSKSIYVIMNMAENGSLLDVIQVNRYIDERRACRWFHHLVEGIAYCHSKGVTHRDLKCENLLLDEKNVIKITDFGFAREGLPHYIIHEEENTNRSILLSSTFCGSYAYACPEVLLQKPYEPHLSDTWSMGIILYSMLFGRLPFDDTNFNSLIRQVLRPIKFHSKPSVSFNARNLMLNILSPPHIRIYIPKIKNDKWYVDNFDPKDEEEYRKPEALRQPVTTVGIRKKYTTM